jgi:hypothetical protein
MANTLKDALDTTVLPTLADALATVKIGSVVRALPTFLRARNMVAQAVSPYQLATLQTLTLPDDAKALTILRAYARTATAGAGVLTVAAAGATPTTGQIAVAPNGDIVTLAADAITSLDVVYQPDKYDTITLTLPAVAATGVAAIPAAFTGKGIVTLLEGEGLVGTTLGKKIVLVPSASATATGNVHLDVAKATVMFAIADALTSVRVKLAYTAAVDVDALLEGASVLI